ncbi:uncharacterized protein LOC129588915 [Paramacrobiotus metropolitanus]|uniref:uncharacterized protein LOC129588915 n=1 Tax=Paramacrobiotus metropolitanus TaxID=2943436 RepID=UPI002445CBAD|nr:uncharacterized protein LOC129588915 [Paramacrobiotus metropolitanus]
MATLNGSEPVPVWMEYSGWSAAWFIIHLTISQAGGAVHLLLIGVLLLERRLRGGSGGLVLHLVVLEGLVCGVHMPLAAILSDGMQRGRWDIRPVCPVIHFLFLTTSQAGYWTSFFLAVNRFIAAAIPHLYPRLTRPPAILAMLTASWTVAVSTTAPLFAQHGGVMTVLPPWMACGIRVTSVPLRTAAQVVGVYIPLVGSVVLYAVSVVLLSRQRRRRVAEEGRKAVPERRLRVARMLLVSTVVLGLAYVPGVVLLAQYKSVVAGLPVVDLWIRTLFLLAYAVQPLRGPVEHLGFDMFHCGMEYVDQQDADGPNQNMVIGTFAAASAAGLIYVGSGGKAERRLSKILHFDKIFEERCTPELITIAFRQAVSVLTKRHDRHFPIKEEKMCSAFQLVLAHRAFFRKGIHVTSEFYNNARAFSLDVGKIEGLSDTADLETLRQEINAWVSQNTHGQVPETLPPLAFVDHEEALTNMFLISVTSLRGRWMEPFPPERIQPDTFRNFNGSEARIHFLTAPVVHLPYFEDRRANVRYLEIPYANNEASLCICLPYDEKKRSLKQMMQQLEYGQLKKIGHRKRLRKVDLKLPIFQVQHCFNLKGFFERIGVEDGPNDDLSKMVNGEFHAFRLTGAYHKCTFGINEHGTCAEYFDESNQPATGDENTVQHPPAPRPRSTSCASNVAPVKRTLKSTVLEPVTFHATHPFIFAVRHNLTAMLLFCGRVVDLTPSGDAPQMHVNGCMSETAVRPVTEKEKTFLERTKEWFMQEKGLIGRKRTGTL